MSFPIIPGFFLRLCRISVYLLLGFRYLLSQSGGSVNVTYYFGNTCETLAVIFKV